MKEKFIPLNNYVLFEQVKENPAQMSKYEKVTTNIADRIPRGRVIEIDENENPPIENGDEFLYRMFQDVPKVIVNGEEYSLIKYEQIYGKYKS